jgi:hypothetical protein
MSSPSTVKEGMRERIRLAAHDIWALSGASRSYRRVVLIVITLILVALSIGLAEGSVEAQAGQ